MADRVEHLNLRISNDNCSDGVSLGDLLKVQVANLAPLDLLRDIGSGWLLIVNLVF